MKDAIVALFVACILVACGMASVDKQGIAKDAAALVLIEQHCELEQKLTEGQAGARAEVDARCEAELDNFDAKGAP